MENARDFVRTSETSNNQEPLLNNLSEDEKESQLRESRKSLSKKTLKKI